ncbi:MAG: exonuclease SbcCD subunit D [Chloroflexi bacterium]|nr:exonuclease SbcCD subunit D [Chloroflexota bacterium]
MKLIHFADLHIGVDAYAKTEAQTGLDSRLRDFLNALDCLVDYALQNKVDGVIFAGDAYKSRDPSQTQQKELATRLKKLAQNNVAVCLLAGNHDVPYSKGKATTLDIFSALDGGNIYVFNKPQCRVIDTKSGQFQLCALPWIRRGVLAEKELNEMGLPLSLSGSNQEIEKQLNALVNNLASIAAQNPLVPAILCAHLWADGAVTGSERSYNLSNEPKITTSALANPAFCYVALGHIHKMQVLRKERPAVVYSGSLERLDFGEEKDDKGFYVLDIDRQGQVQYLFHKLHGRRFVTLKISVPPQENDPLPFILAAIEREQANIAEAIVRIIIELNVAQSVSLKGNAALREALKTAHNFVITRDVHRASNVRLQGLHIEEVTPQIALDEYLKTQNSLNLQVKEKLRDLGRQIIEKTNIIE